MWLRSARAVRTWARSTPQCSLMPLGYVSAPGQFGVFAPPQVCQRQVARRPVAVSRSVDDPKHQHEAAPSPMDARPRALMAQMASGQLLMPSRFSSQFPFRYITHRQAWPPAAFRGSKLETKHASCLTPLLH
jgi:hypothetical protein